MSAKQITLKYKSETRPWSNASGAYVEFTNAWIPKTGPKGGRLVIDRAIAHFVGNIDVATAALQGEDVYRFFGPMTAKQKDGTVRYNEVPGDSMRIFLYECLGADQTKEHPDVAIGNGQTVRATMVIPFEKPNMHEPGDYSLAADELEHIRIRCATSAELSLGSSEVTINSGNYYVIFECHEELDVVYHAVDEVRVQDFSSTTSQEERLNVNGRLQELLLYVRGAEGGASLANLTSAWIHEPQNLAPELVVTPDLKEYYARARGEVTGAAGTTGDPVRSSPFSIATHRAVGVLIATGTKAFESPEIEAAIVKAEHSLNATIRMVARIAKRRNDATQARLRERFKLAPGPNGLGIFRVKTKSNSMRNPGAWNPDLLPYLPIKFVR